MMQCGHNEYRYDFCNFKNGVMTVFVVVVFALNRSFYPTTSAVPPVSFLIHHPREIQMMWSVRQRKNKRWRIKVWKLSASVPGTRAQQKKRHQKSKCYENNTKRIKNKRTPRWGKVQMTRAERTRTIKFVLTESSRWLLHRRRDTKEDKHIRMQEKNKKTKKRKTKSRKQGTKARRKIVLKASP